MWSISESRLHLKLSDVVIDTVGAIKRVKVLRHDPTCVVGEALTVELAVRYVWVSKMLLRCAEFVGGTPN